MKWNVRRIAFLGYLRACIVHPPLPSNAGPAEVLVAGVETNQQQEGYTDRMQENGCFRLGEAAAC